MFGLLRAALLLVLLSCLLAGVSNAKLYRPVSPSLPPAYDECNKKIEKKNNQKIRKSMLKTRLLACSLAEQMKTQDA